MWIRIRNPGIVLHVLQKFFLGFCWRDPWSKEGMEWKQWLKCVVLYWSFKVHKGVEGEGRGCKSLRI